MKTALYLEAEVFYYPTEEKSRVMNALKAIIKDAKPAEEKIESYHGPIIVKITYKTEKGREITDLLKRLKKEMKPEALEEIQRTIRQRVDDEGICYLRFDKQEASEGGLMLTDAGDAVRVKIKTAVYPFSAEKAVSIARDWFA